jgi:hypothetical protein
MRRAILIFVVAMVALSSCAVLEYIWLVPRANGSVDFNSALTNEEVLNRFTQIAQTELEKWAWGRGNSNETYRDEDQGIVEIGPYRKSNVAGFAAHAEIDRSQHRHRLVFTVKGAGPYYMPLPVDKVVQKITCRLLPMLDTRQ